MTPDGSARRRIWARLLGAIGIILSLLYLYKGHGGL